MKRLIIVLFAVMAAACSFQNLQSMVPLNATKPARPHPHAGSYPITHVVIIMQENRSFDNIFHGFPGAQTVNYGYGHGVKYTLQSKPLKWTFDLNHYRWQFLEDYDSTQNDGWDKLIRGLASPAPSGSCPYNDPYNHPACWIFWTGKSYRQMAFSYVNRPEVQPYWTMAKQYALGDHNFATTNGPTFGPHQVLIAGQDGHADEVPSLMPWGCDAPKKETENYLQYGQADPPEFPPQFGHDIVGPFPCFTYKTVADLLDAAKISWRWYKQPDPPASSKKRHPSQSSYNPYDSYWLDAFDAIQAVRNGPDYANVVTPDTQVLDDVANGKLAQVSWVMPHQGASDHPGSGSGNCGPDWVASVVNAIGKSKYWKSTAIVITWDEWGGWFDSVLPQEYPDPSTGAFEGLGYRTPLIVVSPYAKSKYISKSEHETASALHFVEKIFGLPSLGTYDTRADAYDDMFDYSRKPAKFKTIPMNQCSGNPDDPHAPPEIDY